MIIDGRSPCLIGTARRTWHPGTDPAPEPLAMWDELARAAALDASERLDVLAAVDDLRLVHCQSWAYDHPVDRLAQRLGIEGGHRSESILAGTSPQRLIDDAAARMRRGDSTVALIVGGEALATRRAFARAGETPPWSFPHPTPPSTPIPLDEWYLPTELAHGVLPAWLTFALLEQARWAEQGGPSERLELHRVVGHLRSVADTNPDAWFAGHRSTEELTRPSASNRMVASPYTKRMTAFMDVDMAAANLLVTKDVADRWKVPEERRVYLRGWGFARDAVHLAGRARLGSSPAMAAATSGALDAAGLGLDDIDVFDLYSCFPSAVQFATDALSLGPDDRRALTVTGGLPYHGGPSSNYMSHSISHVASRLRSGTETTALVTGIGMHMTKHVAAVWSTTPGSITPVPDPGPQRWGTAASAPEATVVDHAEGTARIAAATVVHDGQGEPDHVIGICELDEAARCYVRTRDPQVIDAVLVGEWTGRPVRLSSGDDGTNEVALARNGVAPVRSAGER